MKYILIRVNYITGVSWWFILGYNEKTREVKHIGYGLDKSRSELTQTDHHISLNDMSDFTVYSSLLNATFDQVMNMLHEYCKGRFSDTPTIDYIIQEIPKKKAFELML